MREYSEKEAAILGGVLELIRLGTDVYRMKVSDIATAAGVGKGTVYDYFSSKEEIITKAMLFGIWQSVLVVRGAVENTSMFKEKFLALLGEVRRLAQERMPVVKIMFSGTDIEKTYEYIQASEDYASCMEIVGEIVTDIIECGETEGAIKKVDDPYYGRLAVLGGIMGHCMFLQGKNSTTQEHEEACAYRLVINALNA